MASIAIHDPRLSWTSGGGEAVTLQLISLLLRAGHKVTAITRKMPHSPLFNEFFTRESQFICKEIEVSEISIDSLPEGDVLSKIIWNCDRLAPEALCFNLASREFYERNQFDLVVVSFIPDLALLATTNSILLNVFGLPPNQAIALAERPLLDRCACFTFASHYAKKQFGLLFGRDGRTSRGSVVHASVDAVFFERRQVKQKNFDACYVGRLTRRKGLYTIIESVDWLMRQKRREITLAIVGDGQEREALDQLARALGIAHQITWFGTVGAAEIVQILDRSSIFLYPTIAPEAFGCSNIEAMARGVPVITTNLGGTTDYVLPGENAMICPVGDSRGLGEAIEALLNNPRLRESLASKGRYTAVRFSQDMVVRGWLNIVESAILAKSGAV